VSPLKSLDASGTSRLAVLGALIVAIACLYWARIVFIPLAAALLATFLLSPVVALLRRIGLHRVAAVVIVLVLTVLLAAGLGWALFSQLTALVDDLPQYRATISRKIADVQRVRRGGTLQKVEETAHDVMAQIERVQPSATKPLPVVVSSPNPLWQIPKIVEAVGGAVFVLVLVVFMLVQQRERRARVVRLFGADRLAETTRALDEASARISSYLLTQTALNASFGVTIAIGLFVLGLPFALTWGVCAALLRFIPYAGAWVAASIPVVVSLAVFDGWMKPLLIVGLFAVAEVIIAFVLEPLFFARSAGVSSIALLISVAFWAWLWGPVGLALAIPLTVWLVVFSHTVKGLEFIGILVDDDPGFDPHVIFYQRVLAGDDQEAAELVHEAVKSGSDLAAYDSILVPALARARHDHDVGQLPAAEYAHVIETTRTVLDRAIAAAPTLATDAPATGAPERVVVAGCPVRDEADRVALTTLNRLLEADGYAVQIAPAGALVAETIAAVVAMNPAAILVSSVQESGRARHLVKRLRAACPEIPIVVGCWGLPSSRKLRTDLCAAGADDVVTTLGQARSDLLRLTPAPEPAGAEDAEPVSALETSRHGVGLAASARGIS
jgi:predicted PurR-regulated permease PerM/methylmalonyl-CoA mutase cobalamin-binding subunit